MRAPGLNFPRRVGGGLPPANIRRHAEEAASRLPPLMVEAERIAATVIQGVHGRRRVGQGDTFWQFRHYQTGDSVQQIDWRQSAKTQSHFVRENEWDAAQSVYLWCDESPSMTFRSDPSLPDKRHRAAVLTLALASLLVRGGEQVAILGGAQPPSNGRAVLHRLAERLSRPAPGRPSAPPVAKLPRHARLVLAGDFLSPVETLSETVSVYAAAGVQGHLLQIADPAEETLPYHGRVRFEGMEGEGAALIGRVEVVQEEYRALMAAHRQAIADLARGAGWTSTLHHTDKPPHTALLALYGLLADGGGR